MSVGLTEEQKQVVEDRGGSLLVSAAAGSGKTRVLVERLFDRVLGPEQADLTDFLVITYTRAAASELRERIAAELQRRAAAGEGDPGRLQRQMLRVYQADIRTVDAFCTALLRENLHLLDFGDDPPLTAGFRVLDAGEAELVRRRVLPRVLEDFYAHMDPGRTLLADAFGFGRDDRGLEDLVLELYGRVQSHPYPEKWLMEQREVWADLPADAGETPWGRELLAELARKAGHWRALLEGSLAEMAADGNLERAYAPGFADVCGQLEALERAASEGWDAARARLPVFPRLAAARKCGGALKDRIKGRWDACRKEFTALGERWAVSAAGAAEDLRRAAPAMEALTDLTLEFSRACRREKLRLGAADFSDQEHWAVRLLLREDGTPTELAEIVSDRYREVMVDEYQDANRVQDCIFRAVSHGGRTLFTVGDVKQSIYRFRLADPGIFLEKYRRLPDARDAAPGEPRRILLSRNFRSRAEVLDAANFVFGAVMSRDMGEADYGEAEKLHFGAAGLPPRTDCRTELDVLDVPPDPPEDAPAVPAALLEARFVAERCARLLREGFPVTDGETGTLRPCRPEDIVILLRSPGPRLRHYLRALKEQGVPCGAGEDGDLFSTIEVSAVYALLQIIDNPRQDVPLIAALRSPVAGFTPDMLARIRAGCPEGDFYEALCASEDPACRAFLRELEALRSLAGDVSVYRLLWTVYDRWNVLGVFGAMEGGAARRENLVALAEYARSFESAGFRGLFAFVSHLRSLLETGRQPERAAGDAAGVQVLSIHRSKGLEYPIVILADLSRRFNRADLDRPVLVHPALGLGPMYIDLQRRVRYPTVARDALRARLSREGRSEEMRLLYVAMTRAKEKLILVASLQDAGKRLRDLLPFSARPVPPETAGAVRSMAEWVLLPVLRRPEAAPLRALAGGDAGDCDLPTDAPWEIGVRDAGQYFLPPDGRERGEAEGREQAAPIAFDPAALRFIYPHAAACAVPTKITATQLKGREADREIAEGTQTPYEPSDFAAPGFLSPERPLSAAQRGVATHLVMQYLPLDGDVDACVEDLTGRRLLTEAEAKAVDRAAIRRFLASPLAEELRGAERVEREYRFSLLAPAGDYYPDMAEDDELLLQGVADLFAVKDGKVTVVDLKTDYVTPETLQERAGRYRPQLAAYSAALERILGLPVTRRVLYFFRTGDIVDL